MTLNPSRGETSRRERRGVEVRAQILAAGRRCFGNTGLYETLVEEIAREAGVAKGTFYLYFRDKEDLIRAVAESVFSELATRLTETVGPGQPWDERLLLIAAVHVRFLTEQPDGMRILHQLRGMLSFERSEWLPLRACIEAHVDLLAGLIVAAPRPRGLTRERAGEIGGALFGAVSGAISVWASIHGDAGLRTLPKGISAAARDLATGLARTSREVPRRRSARRKSSAA